jgi:sortase A
MKRILFVLSLIGIFSGIYLGTSIKTLYASMNRPGIPKELVIPSLNIDTQIEQVGKDKNNAMDVPKKITDVGWFEYGPRPGEKGNAVIDGHLDSLTGPAIFYPLSNMKKDDKILVKDTNGKMYTFVVTEKHIYKYDSFPVDVVFGPEDNSQIELITCAGEFDHEHHNYLDRIVITAVKN